MHKKLFGAIGAIVLVLFTIIGPAGVVSADAATPWDEIVAKAQAAGEVEATIDGDVTLAPDSPQLVVKAGSTLTLTGGGTVVGAGKPAIKVEKGAKLNLNGPSFTKAQFLVDGEMNFTAGAIKDTAVRCPVIFVNGGTLTIDGTANFINNSALEEGEGRVPEGIDGIKYSPVTVQSGSLNLLSGSISSNSSFKFGGAISLWGSKENPAHLNISGGKISKNRIQSDYQGWGGAVFADGATIKMSGGSVSENFTEWGSGLMLLNGKMELTGGVIQKNGGPKEYLGRGGGVFVQDSDFVIDGVTIDENTSHYGAGVMVYRGTVTVNSGNVTRNKNHEGVNGQGGGGFISNAKTVINGGSFGSNVSVGNGGGLCFTGGTQVIKGGEFKDNHAEGNGGGIAFIGESNARIEAAKISGNETGSFWGGGGIYNGNDSKLQLLNSLIKNNTSDKPNLHGSSVNGENHPGSAQGGGVWNCHKGSSVFHVSNGVALFENRAVDRVFKDDPTVYKGAGDDFASSPVRNFGNLDKEKTNPVVLADRMLGGGKRLWYQDGSIYHEKQNFPVERQLARFDENNKGEPIKADVPLYDNLAFKSVPSADSKSLAEKIATVRIENNLGVDWGSTGAGITNNGKLIFGTEDTWKLKINKAWDSDDPNTRPEEIDVDVLVGEFKVDQVHLSKDNGWTAEVLNFPNPATLIDASTGEKLPITFRESGADGYDLAVVEEGDDQAKVYTFNLTNRKLVEVPVEKAWDDFENKHQLRPESIDVELVVDGKASGQKLTLNGDNSWKGKFEKLPKYKDGKELDYSVREVSVESYESKVSGDAKHGFVITNKVIEPNPTPTPTPTTPPKPKKPKLPRTGNAGEMFAITAIGLAAAAAIVLRRRGR